LVTNIQGNPVAPGAIPPGEVYIENAAGTELVPTAFSGDVTPTGTPGDLIVVGIRTVSIPALGIGFLKYTGSAFQWSLGTADQLLGMNHAGSTVAYFSLGGDGSISNGDLILSTVNSNVGTFGGGNAVPVFTVNAKGLITSVSTTAVTPTSSNLPTITLTGDASGSGAAGTIATLVSALDNKTILPLATGYLEYNGTGFVWSTPSGTGLTASSVSGTGFWYSASGSLDLTAVGFSGDATIGALSGGNIPITLASITTAGSHGSATSVPAITIDAKGRVTSVTNTNIAIPLSQLTQSSAATGNTAYWNGSAWTAGSLNLAGGSNYVSNQLPPANLGTITLTGDVIGTGAGGSIAGTVVQLNSKALPSFSGASGYLNYNGTVLSWDNSDRTNGIKNWQPLGAFAGTPFSNIGTLGYCNSFNTGNSGPFAMIWNDMPTSSGGLSAQSWLIAGYDPGPSTTFTVFYGTGLDYNLAAFGVAFAGASSPPTSIAVDTSGNVWVAAVDSTNFYSYLGAPSGFTSSGLYSTTAVTNVNGAKLVGAGSGAVVAAVSCSSGSHASLGYLATGTYTATAPNLPVPGWILRYNGTIVAALIQSTSPELLYSTNNGFTWNPISLVGLADSANEYPNDLIWSSAKQEWLLVTFDEGSSLWRFYTSTDAIHMSLQSTLNLSMTQGTASSVALGSIDGTWIASAVAGFGGPNVILYSYNAITWYQSQAVIPNPAGTSSPLLACSPFMAAASPSTTYPTVAPLRFSYVSSNPDQVVT
jgi:hypothetical protein